MTCEGEPILTWIDSNGQETTLIEPNGFTVLTGALGLGAVPVSLEMADRLSSDGSVLAGRRSPHRNVVLPLFIEDETRVLNVEAQAAEMFYGPGTLRRDDGTTVRELTEVVYETGLAGNDDADIMGPTWAKVVVSLLALDPWWYGQERTVAFEFGVNYDFDANEDFDANIPFDGRVATSTTVFGDAEAFPVTTLSGPFTTADVGFTGGKSFSIADPLADGHTIVVDTRPGNRGPRKNGGPIDWSLLTPESRLWTLPPGVSRLTAATTGEDGGSFVELSYRERHRTP